MNDTKQKFINDSTFEDSFFEIEKIINQSRWLNTEEINYLLSLWGYFYIYQMEPYVGKNKQAKKKKTSNFKGRPKIIRAKSRWKILSYSDGMITSAGDCYGAFATGMMLKTIKFMIEDLAKRGAKTVSFASNLTAAQRFAWIECKRHNITVSHFEPGINDIKCRERVLKVS